MFVNEGRRPCFLGQIVKKKQDYHGEKRKGNRKKGEREGK
jgi:hypothetical protein